MGGPGLEIFKFSLYLFVPIAALVHFGSPEWYRTHVIPVSSLIMCLTPLFTIPYNLYYRNETVCSLMSSDYYGYADSFSIYYITVPHILQTKNIPTDKEGITAHLERRKQELLQAKARMDAEEKAAASMAQEEKASKSWNWKFW
jgi:hypothetical protein